MLLLFPNWQSLRGFTQTLSKFTQAPARSPQQILQKSVSRTWYNGCGGVGLDGKERGDEQNQPFLAKEAQYENLVSR